MIWALAVLVVLLVAVLVALALVVRRAHRGVVADHDEHAARQDAAHHRVRQAAMVRELRPSFAGSIRRLKGLARGIDFRYGVPWYLLIGPEGAGKSTLVNDAHQSVLAQPDAGGTRAASSIGWHYFDGGVVIDVAASLALPGARGDLNGWRALLRLLKGHRPRRPADGVLLAIPASLLVDDRWKGRVQDLGAAIRERLALAQSEFGFALPVYVIVTQADRIRGFSAFAGALPDNLRQDMFGWSNPHAPDSLFQGGWINDGITELHRGVVRAQVELFATSHHLDQPSELFLFSGELQHLASPLRALLEEVFRPSVYEAAFFFRGFYLAGRMSEHVTRVDGVGDMVLQRSIGFLGDVLDRKVFPERGLAAPLSGTSVGRNHVSLTAQIAAALLAVVLGVGTYVGYGRLDEAKTAHDRFFTDVASSLELHRQVAARQRTTTSDEELAQGFALLQSVEELSTETFHSLFFPASYVEPIEPAVAGVLTVTFGHLILPDFRGGLEEKGRTLFAWTPSTTAAADAPEDPVSPVLADSQRYRALQEFAATYRTFVDNYFRFGRLTVEDDGTLTDLADLGNYLTGRSSMVGHALPDDPYGRALRQAVTSGVNCQFALGPASAGAQRENLIRRRASALLADFSSSWFGDDNPVLATEKDFASQWRDVARGGGDVRDLMTALGRLSQSVATWASIGGRSGELRIPVFDQAPFRRIESPEICGDLAPDLSSDITAIAKLRDDLGATLTMVRADPFGPLLKESGKGLVLDENLAALKTDLDALAAKDFWAALPDPDEGVLPTRATWRAQSIEQAIAMVTAFDEYRGSAFDNLDPAFRRPLVTALTSGFARGLAAHLSFEATEAPVLPSDSAALQAEVTRIGAAAAKMQQLLPLFDADGNVVGRDVIQAMDAQAAEALQALAQDASARHPDVFARETDFVLNAWSDVQAEAATPADATKRWTAFADERRASLRQYALNAQPLVQFLLATAPASPALRQWTPIVEDVVKSDQKMAGNGFDALDAFVRDGIPNLTPEKDCTVASATSRRMATGAFIGVRDALADIAIKRCRDSSRRDVASRYAAIAQAFTRLLAGRFPFSASVDGVRDVQPADLVEFLRAYDRADGRVVAKQIEARACSADAALFMRRIDALYPMFAPAKELQAPAVLLDVVPEFRANADRDVGGNQIAEWRLDVGRQSLRRGDPPKPLRWVSGDHVSVTLRFAKDSPEVPRKDSRFVLADARTLRYDFARGWALFAWLRAGRAAPADPAAADPASSLLRFEIPVQRDPEQPPIAGDRPSDAEPFRVFIRVRLFQPGKQEPLVVGDFPTEAPAQASCAAG